MNRGLVITLFSVLVFGASCGGNGGSSGGGGGGGTPAVDTTSSAVDGADSGCGGSDCITVCDGDGSC